MSQFTASDGEERDAPGKMDAATHEASEVTTTAREAAQSVAETSAREAAAVAGVAKDRVADLVSQSRRELADQAAGQQQRLAVGLGTMGDDLSRMADADENGGFAGELVRRAASHVSTVGTWLGDRDPQQLLHDVTGFARRRPGTFIAAAAIAGIVVGRLSRALAAGASTGDASSTASASDTADGPRFAEADAAARAAEAPLPSTEGDAVVDDTGLVAGVDGGDPPLYTESAARLGGTDARGDG
ncbi:hypothetical protein [Microbacterium sp. NPDC086615]|uniref:hypothetical protein n=1 Tax=Microbacterium sp. NPDC086615 TaxID=3154865 RepID=UPI0034354B7E